MPYRALQDTFSHLSLPQVKTCEQQWVISHFIKRAKMAIKLKTVALITICMIKKDLNFKIIKKVWLCQLHIKIEVSSEIISFS